jgi:uncharacterized protein (TIGR01244 family)
MKIQVMTIAATAAFSAGLLVSVESPSLSAAFATEEHPVTAQSHQVTSDFSVSPQISPADVSVAASNGVTLIINNRPDGEMIGQPKSADIAAAAEAAGIAYAYIPVDHKTGVTPEHIAAFERAMAEAKSASGEDGKTLAFCRSGMRSILVRSHAAASEGEPVTEIISEAAAAGYDISGHAPALEALAPKN